MVEFLKAVLFGIVEGITEWLPVSSTGHMILLEQFVKLESTPEFIEMFRVVIQLGAILAVVLIFWNKLFPFTKHRGSIMIKKNIFIMWCKIVVACIPAVIVGVFFDEKLNELFYNYQTVAIALIVFGILFIVIENKNKHTLPKINSIKEITFQTAFIIGLFQVIAAVFPGTSRSGATIVGALMIGVSRTAAAEFTFFLAVPVMFGASFLKMLDFGFKFTPVEIMVLITGMASAFIVSIIVIKFLMEYIKKHDFKVFGWYRIVLGLLVIVYFLVTKNAVV